MTYAEFERRNADLLEANNRYQEEARAARAEKRKLERVISGLHTTIAGQARKIGSQKETIQIFIGRETSTRERHSSILADIRGKLRAAEDNRTARTDEEIVEQTESLARLLMEEAIGTGYVVGETHVFHEAKDHRSKEAWRVACSIMEQLTHTDPNDAVASLELDDAQAA